VQARLSSRSAALLAATALVAGAVLIPAASGSDSTRAGELRRESGVLQARSASALLELYALETKLARAQTELASIRARADVLERERESVRLRLRLAGRTLARAEELLARRLLQLYERGETHPLEVLLGAGSLEQAVTELDGLRLAAAQDQVIGERTRAARQRLLALSSVLDSRSAELRRLEGTVAAEAAALAHARGERAGYLARLARERRLRDTEIATLEREAQAALARTPASIGQPGANQVTVVATGYTMRGRTSTGIPAGHGVVAVDPDVISLGTRMSIPGYGRGFAADVGSSVQGARIDIWFPSRAKALAWGRRTVTVSLH
jgi:3D (Asp-Asp-Asp) domain-containing protein